MAIHSRLFASEHDFEQMRQLVADWYARSGPANYCTPGDLDWWRFPHGDQGGLADARLWFKADEQLVGFAWPNQVQTDLIVDPDFAPLQNDILAWVEEHRLRTYSGDDTPTLTVWALDQDEQRRTLLAERGYQPTGSYYCVRARSLTTPIEAATLPDGYRIDHIRDHLIESRAAAQRDAFQSTKMTAGKYRRLDAAPTYRQTLDLVAVDPEGEVAAFALVWFDAANRAGTFEPVGTRHAQQRRGLARALLFDGMRRLREQGADTALVVSEGDSASNHFYDAAGMRPIGRDIAWEKQLPGTPN
jgi:predicted N-acetyltransferase YhbS